MMVDVLIYVCFLLVFFFKQKTAYEMRISDWSSDVCSSDLIGTNPGLVEWIDEHDVAERLRLLRADRSAWRAPRDTGQFSLTGAQPKTALLFANGKWACRTVAHPRRTY